MRIFTRNKQEMGLIAPDYTDPRDYQLAEIQGETVELPKKFLLRDKMTSIQHQNWGTCVSHATDAIKEFLDTDEYGKEIKLSQKFIYLNMKKISGLWSIQGDYLRNGLKSLADYGACLETTFPDIKRSSWNEYIKDKPSSAAYEEGKIYKIKSYWSVGRTLGQIRSAIHQNSRPVALGMAWYSSLNRPDKDGRLALPSGNSSGGHAIACIGWDDEKLWFRNSWGTQYGDNGYFYMPFSDFDKYSPWNAWVALDIIAPKTQTKEGWVADKWLKNKLKKGDVAHTMTKLNFRDAPWGNKIDTLDTGEELEILGEKKSTTNLVWQKVKRLK